MSRAIANKLTLSAPPPELGRVVRLIRVDIGKAAVRCAVFQRGDAYVIPIKAELPDDEFIKMTIEVSTRTFEKAIDIANARGLTAVRLADLAERFIGHRPFFSIEARELPPGSED